VSALIGGRRLHTWPRDRRPHRDRLHAHRRQGGHGEGDRDARPIDEPADDHAERHERAQSDHHPPEQVDERVAPVAAVREDREHRGEHGQRRQRTGDDGSEPVRGEAERDDERRRQDHAGRELAAR